MLWTRGGRGTVTRKRTPIWKVLAQPVCNGPPQGVDCVRALWGFLLLDRKTNRVARLEKLVLDWWLIREMVLD